MHVKMLTLTPLNKAAMRGDFSVVWFRVKHSALGCTV
jgi:hypothetical protein